LREGHGITVRPRCHTTALLGRHRSTTKHRNVTSAPGYWQSPWPGEDNGPDRLQVSNLRVGRDSIARSMSRLAPVSTMVVLRDPGEVFLLCHTGGDDAVSWVERIDPRSLAVIERSKDLSGGPTWPGGIAAHANGSLYVVFGRYLHHLSSTLEVLDSRELPRQRPYNSFVVLPRGEIVTKDFGGARPGEDTNAMRSAGHRSGHVGDAGFNHAP